MSSLRTYPHGLDRPDFVKHADPTRVPGRVMPGDAVVHGRHGGYGIVVAVDDTGISVLWSVEPSDPMDILAKAIRKLPPQTPIQQSNFQIQPMTAPQGLIFYLDYTYCSGSKGETKDDGKV